MSDQRYLRQQQIIPRERLQACRASVIGVGAVGRQVALQLAMIGVGWLQLIDPDHVEEVNLAPQGYLEADLGAPKVEATAEFVRRINHGVDIQTLPQRFRRSLSSQLGNVVFCCVDSIETRKLIWDAAQDQVRFWADGRMSAEVLRVLCVGDERSRAHYPTTLFSGDEAFVGPCTARSTIYCANICAAMMVSGLARWLRRLPVDPDMTLNLLATELTVVR